MKSGRYEMVVAPDDYPGKRYRGNLVYEHQLVWWQNTGTLVPKGYVLRHLNDCKRDNRFSNLCLESRSEQGVRYSKAKPKGPPVQATCGWCNATFELPQRSFSSRMKQSVSGLLFCCGSHHVRHQQARLRATSGKA